MKSYDDFLREQQEELEEWRALKNLMKGRRRGGRNRNRGPKNQGGGGNNPPKGGRNKPNNNGGGKNRGGRGIPGAGAAATVLGGGAHLAGSAIKGLGGLAMNAAKELLKKQEAPTSVNSAQKLTPAEKI